MNRSVIHLVDGAKFYGAEAVVLNLSLGLKRVGIRSMIGCFSDGKRRNEQLAALAKSNGIDVRYVREKKKLDFAIAKQIRDTCCESKVAFVNSHGYKSSFYSMIAKIFYGIPFIVTCHSWTKEHPKLRFYNYLGKISMLFSERVVAVSETVASEIGNWPHIRRKLRVIQNGINIENRLKDVGSAKKQVLRKELGVKEVSKLVGTLGRLIPLKAHDDLIRAAKIVCEKMCDVEFILAGDGPLLSSLKVLAKRHGISDRFHFLGFRDDAISILQLLDVFVLPSKIEGLPISLLEAMAIGKPVVATEVGGIPSVIRDGFNGLLVQPGDVMSLAQSIVALLCYSDYREELSRKGKATVSKQFSMERMAKDYASLYKELWIQ